MKITDLGLQREMAAPFLGAPFHVMVPAKIKLSNCFGWKFIDFDRAFNKQVLDQE